jgi:hypothetical protein
MRHLLQRRGLEKKVRTKPDLLFADASMGGRRHFFKAAGNNTPPTGQMMPKRIQLKRIRGWRLPDNAVKISRPGKWGNPFVITDKVHPGHMNGGCYYAVPTLEDALACYQEYLEKRPDLKRDAVAELAGKDLACFCREGEPCHGDILIAVANGLEYKPYVATNDAEQYELPVMS